ncbi:Syndecan [Frankliniella fusca]|uniref:Syndecan n=1 Tax=Frankliniella fusca TaxID=407009 RepID=A0AAE1HEW5_9NEOP|nr:Syndecan [Frankliniella fusca]
MTNSHVLMFSEDNADVKAVDPGILAVVVIGVLCGIALLFTMAVFMDRRNRKQKPEGSRGLSANSTRITILDDMTPDPTSDPPAAYISHPGTSSDC